MSESHASLPTGLRGFAASPQRGQLVLTPSEKAHLLSFTREAVRTSVRFRWHRRIPRIQFRDLLGATLLASGTVTLSQVVHDVPGDAPGALVVHVTANGIVELTSGGQARLHAMGAGRDSAGRVGARQDQYQPHADLSRGRLVTPNEVRGTIPSMVPFAALRVTKVNLFHRKHLTCLPPSNLRNLKGTLHGTSGHFSSGL